VVWGLSGIYLVRGEFATARELSEQLLRMSQTSEDSGLRLEAHRHLGNSLFHLGDLRPARAHLEQAVSLYDSQRHRCHTYLYGQDPGVFALSYLAWVLWHLGYPDQARVRCEEALLLARGVAHPFTLAFGLTFAAWFHTFRRDAPATREAAEASMDLST